VNSSQSIAVGDSKCAPQSSRSALTKLVVVGGVIAALVAATPFAFRAGGDNAYIAVAVVTGILTYAAAALAGRAQGRRVLFFIVGLAIAFRGYALFFEPFLSSDIYRYIWDGIVQAHGINPYRFVPADPALAHLRDAAIYPNINRADYALTIYPPVAQFFFLLVTRFGASTVVMRVALLGCEAVSVLLMLLFLRRMQQPLTQIVAYAWHPLPIWEIANGGHVDALMVALMLLGIWIAVLGRAQYSALMIALASLVKPFAAPALAAIWRPWDWKMPLAVIAAVIVCYLPYVSVGWGVLGFLPGGYLEEEGLLSGEGFWLLSLWRLGFGEMRYDVACYAILAVTLLLTLAFRVAFRRERTAGTTLADVNMLLLAVLLVLSPSYPWYFLMIVPFLALLGSVPTPAQAFVPTWSQIRAPTWSQIRAPTFAPTWAASIGALLLTNETESTNNIPWLIARSLLFGSVLICWALSIWTERAKQSSTEQMA
jgi:alpha-1,6-mannosyltransferase